MAKAKNVYGTTTEDSQFNGNLLSNDSGGGKKRSIGTVLSEQGGISGFSKYGATINFDTYSGEFTYDSSKALLIQELSAGDILTDTFTYTVIGSGGKTESASGLIVVQGVNDAPIAVDDVKSTAKNVPLVFTATDLLANDIDIDKLDFLNVTSVGTAAHGTVRLLNGHITYIPNENYTGADSFTYTVSDGKGGETVAKVSVDVTAMNTPPAHITLSRTSFDENTFGAVVGELTAEDADETGSLTFSVLDPNSPFEAVMQYGSWLLRLKSDRRLAHESAPDGIAVGIEVQDSTGLAFDKTFTISINDLDRVLVGNDAVEAGLYQRNNLQGYAGDDSITGGSAIGGDVDNDIFSGTGADTLIGGRSSDGRSVDNSFFLDDFSGDDKIVGGGTGTFNQLFLNGTSGSDDLLLSATSWTLGEITNQQITGIQQINYNAGEGDDRVDAGQSELRAFLTGGTGDDTLIGGNNNTEGGFVQSFFVGDGTSYSAGEDVLIAGSNNAVNGIAYNIVYGDGQQGDIGGNDTIIGGNNTATGGSVYNYLYGNEGDDIITAGTTVQSGSTHNRLDGGNGSDTFIFMKESKGGTIGDFELGSDKIDVSAYFASFAELMQNTSADGVIDLDGVSTLRLLNVSKASLLQSDFLWG